MLIDKHLAKAAEEEESGRWKESPEEETERKRNSIPKCAVLRKIFIMYYV
jgi:hypothetical protein